MDPAPEQRRLRPRAPSGSRASDNQCLAASAPSNKGAPPGSPSRYNALVSSPSLLLHLVPGAENIAAAPWPPSSHALLLAGDHDQPRPPATLPPLNVPGQEQF
ncbi:hypothetical protein VPH35_104524 [Triticum aestivum]|uniref:Uncharacterized protein n=1 Tax=Triticum urartu TaxID=4572 RepID=A0A8R7UUY2_TRIUA